MEWLNPLLGQIVGLDTAPLIYLIENHAVYLPLVRPFFQAVDRGEIEAVTSTLTLTEILVHPLRRGDHRLAQQYSSILLNAAHVTTLPVSPAIAVDAAQLRSSLGYKTPDAIQIATARSRRAAFFLTNDDALTKAPGLQVLSLRNLLSQT